MQVVQAGILVKLQQTGQQVVLHFSQPLVSHTAVENASGLEEDEEDWDDERKKMM